MMYKLRQMLTQKTRDEQGFTLVELLMVMVIIGVLAGLGFTGFNALRKRQAVTQADTYWRDLSTAVRMLEVETGAYPTDLSALGEFIDSGSSPWSDLTTSDISAGDSGDPDVPGPGLAYHIGVDSNGDGTGKVCVWMNGYSSSHNDSCADGSND